MTEDTAAVMYFHGQGRMVLVPEQLCREIRAGHGS